MKKTKLLLSFVFICIILSFFSVSFADYENENNNFLTITGHNGKSHADTETDHGIIINQANEEGGMSKIYVQKTNSNVTLHAEKSGLYAITLYTISWNDKDKEMSQEAYSITENGKHLKIPAHKEGNDYVLYSNTVSDGTSTSVVVYLEEGHDYKMQFNGLGAFNGNGEKCTIRYLPQSETDEIVMSGYSTEWRTNKKTSMGDNSSNSVYPSGSGAPSRIPNSQSGRIRTPQDKPQTGVEALKTKNEFEEAFVSLLIAIGDFFTRLMDNIVGEDVTVTSLIYNKVNAVNANFFDPAARSSGIGGVEIGDAINKWYQFFKGLAIGFYLVALLTIGIHVLLNSTASGMQKARELIVEWAKGIAILFLMPMAMKWVFRLNEGLVKEVRGDANVPDTQVGSAFQVGQEWSAEEIEFRSPQYISKYTGRVTFGSAEANKNYLKKLGDYQANFDLMRIMRAYAGATGTIGYTLLWYVLIGQLIVFLFLYYKRYFMIAFLIAVFPVTCIFNAISIMQGKKGPQMSMWFKELVTNVFTQFFHAIVYAIITGMVVQLVKNNLTSGTSSSANWILIIVAINFVPEGEKIIRKMIKSLGSGKTGPDVRSSASGLKGMYHNTVSNVKNIMGGFRGK